MKSTSQPLDVTADLFAVLLAASSLLRHYYRRHVRQHRPVSPASEVSAAVQSQPRSSSNRLTKLIRFKLCPL